jgi:hypothetical protein
MVEFLPIKSKTLSSNSSTTKKKKKKRSLASLNWVSFTLSDVLFLFLGYLSPARPWDENSMGFGAVIARDQIPLLFVNSHLGLSSVPSLTFLVW